MLLGDAMQFAHPLFRAMYVGGGLKLITRLPRLYHLAYQLSDRPAVDKVLRGPRYHTQQLSTRRLYRVVEQFHPHALLCTHFLPAELCAKLDQPLCTVVTDFDPHPMWQHAGTARYCVPTAAARDRLIHDGADPAVINVTGIPIDPRFAALPDRLAAARRLQLDPQRPTLLIMGGGLGVGSMEAVARALLTHPLDAQIVFITGRNHGLRRRLKALSRQWVVRGFVPNMPDWLAVADLAISKAGGLAASELLAAGVPTIVPRALTGHEALNAEYFASTGAARLVDAADEGVAQAERLLRDPIERAAMRRAAQQAARPQAAADIAAIVLDLAYSAIGTMPYATAAPVSTR